MLTSKRLKSTDYWNPIVTTRLTKFPPLIFNTKKIFLLSIFLPPQNIAQAAWCDLTLLFIPVLLHFRRDQDKHRHIRFLIEDDVCNEMNYGNYIYD